MYNKITGFMYYSSSFMIFSWMKLITTISAITALHTFIQRLYKHLSFASPVGGAP